MSDKPTTVLFLIAIALIFAVKAVALVVVLSAKAVSYFYLISVKPAAIIDYSPIFENMEID